MLVKSPMRIKIENFINGIFNKIVNNRFSNFVKELFPLGYPEYMFCDDSGEYVSNIATGKNDDGFKYMDVTLVDKDSYALDMTKYNPLKRKSLMKQINKLFDGQKVFRYRRILQYNKLDKNNIL